MPNSLQNTIDYIQPFCRYQAAGIGQNGQPILGIASLVRNIILAAPFTWDFNRAEDQSITTVIGVSDYPTTIVDFGFLEKASLQDIDGKWWEFTDVQNNEPLARSSTEARPSIIASQGFTQIPTTDAAIVSKFQFADFSSPTTFTFTIPETVEVDDQIVFVIEGYGVGTQPVSVTDSLSNTYAQVAGFHSGSFGTDVYNTTVTTAGTATVTVTYSAGSNVLVQGLLLRGVGAIQTTPAAIAFGSATNWQSNALTVTQPTALVTFSVGFGPPALIADSFESQLSGYLASTSPSIVQVDTATLTAVNPGAYQSHFVQATSAVFVVVLVGFSLNAAADVDAPVFRFSAVPDKAYPIDLVYQKLPVNFTQTADLWSPIPDSFSDVYNNLVLGYYMDSCQDPRAPQYISRGIAGLLARASGLSATDKAVFAASYMSYAQAQAVSALTTQQGVQATGSR